MASETLTELSRSVYVQVALDWIGAIARMMGERSSIDEQTQAWVDRLSTPEGRASISGSGFETRPPLLTAIDLRRRLRHSVPLRNADHYFQAKLPPSNIPNLQLFLRDYVPKSILNYIPDIHVTEAQRTPAYLLKKMIKDPTGNSWPDPWGQLKWGMKPMFESKEGPPTYRPERNRAVGDR